MDKLVDVLASAGPLGILCGVLLAIIVSLSLFINKLLEMYVESQKERIKDAIQIQDFIHRQNDVIQNLRDVLLSSRNRK